LPKNPNKRPSTAIAYIHLGKEKSDPNNVVVIPQMAPKDTTYLIHCCPTLAKASGKAALHVND